MTQSPHVRPKTSAARDPRRPHAGGRAQGPVTLPDYGNGSLAELLPSVLAALGVQNEVNALSLPAAPRYCVLLVDGLGHNLLAATPSKAPFLSSLLARGRAITSGLPSTTASSLTSLGTGLVPGRHGVVGYTSRVRLPGGDALLNALTWDQPIDATAYQPHGTVFDRARAAGVAATVVSKRVFRGSGLTNVGLRGARYRGADSMGERVAEVASALRAEARAIVYVYDSDLDSTGHRRGWRSEAWAYQLAAIDMFAEMIDAAMPPDAVLVVTGDHGMVDVPSSRRLDVDATPGLRDDVTLIGGEARFRQVYVRPGAADDVAEAWRETLGPRALVLSRQEAVTQGWFGAVDRRVLDRIGDVVVAALGDTALMVPSVFPQEDKLVGMHGSVSADEVLVPLLVSQPV